ncbi:hypothetical protein M9H77_34698 [Catharanthus roseus]|uniref:Uncharacterized protein n=1 Tax=Catharanthus roseus TaxID=4058 RepID=A0ACB9ZM63_CATRO|nr:hypothetical protein M9H77_34698 [Catharanthus roseus]
MNRATPGGAGGVNTVGNYATVLRAQSAAKDKGYFDVLYLDCVQKKYLEEVSSCNVFIVKSFVSYSVNYMEECAASMKTQYQTTLHMFGRTFQGLSKYRKYLKCDSSKVAL